MTDISTEAARMQNALRIMHSLDEVSSVLPPSRVSLFHRDPLRAAILMDAPTWERVFALIEERQSGVKR